MSLTTKICSSAGSIIGKHKIPKYLYHITPTKNARKILENGLKMTEDELFGEGVFMFDLANFTKFWTKAKFGSDENLAKTLLNYVSRRADTSISVFRIQTKNLPPNALSVRRQDRLFQISDKYPDIYDAYAKHEISGKVMDELSIGSPATHSNKFDRKKVPIEYILEEDIPAQNVQLYGTAKVDHYNDDIKSVFKNLFRARKENLFVDIFL